MDKYGIIAGGGELPIIIYNSLKKNNLDVFLIGIKNNFKKVNSIKKYEEVKIGSLSKIFKILNQQNINKLIFAGSIKRPSISELSLDLKALEFLRLNKIESLGDDNLLKKISKYFEKYNYEFVNLNKLCPSLFSSEKFLTVNKPSKIAYENLKKGKSIFKIFGKTDVGQSMIIQNKIIMGLEAVEGTNDLIKRCFKYKRKGDKGILLKLKKINQDIRFDLPAIGINTLKLLKKYDYEGLFIEKNYCIIIDKKRVIEYANNNKIFISNI